MNLPLRYFQKSGALSPFTLIFENIWKFTLYLSFTNFAMSLFFCRIQPQAMYTFQTNISNIVLVGWEKTLNTQLNYILYKHLKMNTMQLWTYFRFLTSKLIARKRQNFEVAIRTVHFLRFHKSFIVRVGKTTFRGNIYHQQYLNHNDNNDRVIQYMLLLIKVFNWWRVLNGHETSHCRSLHNSV